MRQPNPSSKKSAETNTNSINKTNKTTPCCVKVGLKRGPWTPEEDEILSSYINKEGSVGRWRTLPKRAGLARCGKSCRLRWMNYLRPSVKRGRIAPDEEDLILRLHRLLGNRWSLIAGRIPGRTDNEIKNYWNTHLSKKLISQGIDPRTHKPLDSNTLPSNDKPSTSLKPNLSQNPSPKLITSQPSPNVPNQFNENYGYIQGGMDNMDYYQGLNLQISSDGIQNEENDKDENINYCTDDVFSSFLNSLIDEDIFSNNQNQMQQQNIINGHNILPQVSNLDASISFPQVGFAFGAGWDASIMSMLNQNNEPNGLK